MELANIIQRMELTDIIQRYINDSMFYLEQKRKLEQKVEQKKAQILRLEKRIDKLKYPSWVDNILEPIAEAMLWVMEGWEYYDIMGPFGITSETSIYFYREGVPEENKCDSNNFLAIHFRPLDIFAAEIVLVDCTKNTQIYTENTIDEINGMNHPTIPLKKTIAELVIYLDEQNNHILSEPQ